jgi:nitrogen regulatory protein P-II 1
MRETEMKLVTAVVRSEKLDDIIDAVIDNGGRGLTATTVRGFGQQFGERAARAAEADPTAPRAVLLTKVRLDVLVLDEDAPAMVDAIAKHARMGIIGDGKIWVSPVDSALRVRTGERDRDAL